MCHYPTLDNAETLTEYTNKLLQSMQRVYGAQNEMSIATQQLSKQLLAYEKQNFALSKGDEEVISTLQRFARVVDELNSLHTELAKQLADTMIFPMIQFRERDLTGIHLIIIPFSCLFLAEHDAAMAKYSKLPKRRENEKLKSEVVAEVASARKKQHQTSLQYYCALNALQYRKRGAMLDPLLGFTQGQINFFKMGVEMFSKTLEDFLSSVATMVHSIQGQLDTEAESMRLTQQELLLANESVYIPDNNATAAQPAKRNLLQKAGYLNIRNKTGLVSTSWERLYFFTQGGNLMCQPRGAVAGGLILDLDNCSVMAVDCEDRRYCFQITAPSGKTGIILQAEGKQEYEEWICTINNISRQIYLTDNPEAIAIKLNQTAVEAVTPMSTFQKKHESLRPERFYCFTDSLLHQVFVVRLLGSVEARSDQSSELIHEAMRQVLAARAIHNVFRTTELHLVVNSSSLRFVEPQTKVQRISFALKDVTLFATNQDNKRLIGLVVRTNTQTPRGATLNCYIFETNDDGEKICSFIKFGKDIAQTEKVRGF
uniref:Adaptor protein, phosphotyrosine interacting with PH domain and leucine zipper 2 n=1 Tax=Callorhinchus milii TaxID=7868 RepID=A0A4W3HP00_CALMI